MKVRELITMLSAYDNDREVLICADNGSEDDPADLSFSAIRMIDDGPEDENSGPTLGIWCDWGISLEPLKPEDH